MNELYHHGVPGMKWGHRKAKIQAAAKERVRSRRNKADAKIEYLKKTKPNSAALTKAQIKSNKIKKSRYGQTNGQIIAESLLRDIGTSVVGGTLSAVAETNGKYYTSKAIESISITANTVNAANTVYKLSTNYKPKKKK